ncbi:MAG: maleylpyruvate isomerase N-terminal domain-containing protein [Dehalococcoidia bacterium]|nr:maleylpyruvate isomerase N-terminal domain-containing protein [Dehalococcoidia bacterium]
MTISKQELAQAIRFAGDRAATAAHYTKDWNHQLGHQWTSGDAFRHIAATAAGLERLAPLLDAGVLDGVNQAAAAANNAQTIEAAQGMSREEVIQAIRDGAEQSAKAVEAMDDADLAKTVTLGGYEMPKGEILAQIWVHHQIAHAYEASARWPLL